jgi:hypothetical protein
VSRQSSADHRSAAKELRWPLMPVGWRQLLLLLGLCACIEGECAAPVVAARSSCADPDREIIGRLVESGKLTEVAAQLTLVPGQGDSLEVRMAMVLSGNCLELVSGVGVSAIYLKNASILRWTSGSELQFTPINTAPPDRFMALDPQSDRPVWDAGEFGGAARVDSIRTTAGMYTYYLGVWRASGRSLLATFFRAPDGRFSIPKTLLQSQSPIRSVSYFPGIDSPSGAVWVTVESGDELAAYGLQWQHPQLYK